jgi:hypothetical protein
MKFHAEVRTVIDTLGEYRKTIDSFNDMMRGAPAAKTPVRLSEDRWTLREMAAHLVDSASNNHQRFVRLQMAEVLEFPAYEAESWRGVEKPNGASWDMLVGLWKHYNDFILHLLSVMDETCLDHYWKKGAENITLRKLVEDYYGHIRWHMELFEKRLKELSE